MDGAIGLAVTFKVCADVGDAALMASKRLLAISANLVLILDTSIPPVWMFLVVSLKRVCASWQRNKPVPCKQKKNLSYC